MWPFFSFYGGKWRATPHYPKPTHKRIIEPFAGAAGYSTRYADHDVVLVERDPTIVALWRYLIAATPEEIRALPLVPLDGSSVEDLDVTPAAKSLIGFWLNKATTSPAKRPGAWMREGLRPKSFWGPEIQERIASQVPRIKHWTVIEGDYREAPTADATWFIDPPYQLAGRLYRFSSARIDYAEMAEWSRTRSGQTIVCENEGADWLPFEPFLTIKSTEGRHGKAKSKEAIWLNG